MTGKVETGENVNLSVSVRSYFMQAACSANRKKCQAVSFATWGVVGGGGRILPSTGKGKDT